MPGESVPWYNARRHPPIATAFEVSGAELVELIIRHRRRIHLMMFASYSCATAAAGVMLTAAAYQFRGGMGPAWAAAAGGLALGTATLLAWLRCPTVRATAARLDRELCLDDRVAAALEARDGHEPVAPLIVRDALLRLRGIRPAQVFPMKLGRPAALAAASIAGAALLFAIAVPPGPDRASAARGVGLSSASGARSTAAGPLRARSSDSTGERGVPGSPQVAAPSAAAGQQAAPAGGQPGTTSTRAPGAQRASTADSSQSPGGTTAGGPPSGDGRRSTNSPNAADGSGSGAAAGGAPSGATRATGAPLGRGASGETVGEVAAGAGGVQGEALRSRADEARTLRGGLRSAFTTRSDDAWTRADGALSSDAVPPRRRSFVRDYFNAVRRPAQK